MNALPNAAATPDTGTVDARNPWLGLASFTEETRGFFYGRDEEVAELARRVQRKLLTVLFGQSGLGKTSILRAGLVPRLRGQGYCPVYVRIDYSREAPEPAEQIKRAIASTARRSGEWTQVGVAVAGESLWEFLHHRDDVLRDEQGQTLIPLLIFDQFEEIFTLAQTDDFGRARAARFIADLADLVENRPPKEFEARLEADDAAAERFDFARSDYRVLIALREDYLAPLEGLKAQMPSVTQNRLRLAPMNGPQALEAVLKPGAGLVTQEVAEAIVRFVAGGAELANAEVEPSLLSLICRELNDTRLVQGRHEISLDLLAGSHESILSNFYERSLADQAAAVRRVIEDELLTESGFRENVAEERVLSSFAAAGAAPDTLATLVNRRLLRIEERLDVRRVEITHDVLCGVVKQSRDIRHEREARDATERLLNEQRERAQRARQALIRARQIALVCIVLALGAIVAAGLAYRSTQRARKAEAAAEAARVAADDTRTLAEQARGQAEQLLGYLTEDFARELEGFGRLDLVAELARRQMDYFRALPPALKSGDTARNGALAMVYFARAQRSLGKNEAAVTAANEAIGIFEQLQKEGDHSDAVVTALSLALSAKGAVLDNQRDPTALAQIERAVAIIEPIASANGSSPESRRAYTEALERLGYLQVRARQDAKADVTLTKAMAVAAASGALDLTDIEQTARYCGAAAWRLEALGNLGRGTDGQRIGREAAALGDRLLEQRPNYLLALRGRQLLGSALAQISIDELHIAEAIPQARRSEAISTTLWKLDPDNKVVANNLTVDRRILVDAYWELGQGRQSREVAKTLTKPGEVAEKGGVWFIMNGMFGRSVSMSRLAEVGDDRGVADLRGQLVGMRETLKRLGAGPMQLASAECHLDGGDASVSLVHADFATVRDVTARCLERMAQIKAPDAQAEFGRNAQLYYFGLYHLMAQFELGHYAEAVRAGRTALEIRKRWQVASNGERRDVATAQAYLAAALAKAGDSAAAAAEIAPAIAAGRAMYARNRDDAWQRFELAQILYLQSVVEPANRATLVREALDIVSALPAEMREFKTVKFWHARLESAGHAAG
ncbi:MAG: hypothetical protein JSR73_09510 [Proteobacteria bacterium]|nr:hypothetical protein [Pseudomonadota bacterium]